MSHQSPQSQGGEPAPPRIAARLDRPGSSAKPIDILVLDDSEFDAMALERSFDRTHLPIRVTTAGTLEDFRSALAERTYDLVFIDYLLPEGDGLEAIEILRASDLNGDTPAVMITNDARYDVAVAAIRNGCLDYISKSGLEPGGVKEIILRALREPGGRPSAPVPRDNMISIIREVLREEIAASREGQDEGLLIRTLAAHGVIPAANGEAHWEELLTEETPTFIFRPQ